MHLFQGFLNLLFLVLQAPILVQCVLNFSVFPTQPSRVELDKGAFLTTTPLPAAESDGAQPKQEAAETPTGPDTDPKSKEVVYAQVEGCYNCKMLRLPEVKKFVDNDLPKYENTRFKNRNGVSSVDLRLMNGANRTVAAMEIRSWKRAQLNQFLRDKGFKLKEEYQNNNGKEDL